MCIRDRGWHDPRVVPYGPIPMDPACSCLHYAQEEAERQGYSQVLWLDAVERKYVEEVGSMNVLSLIHI